MKTLNAKLLTLMVISALFPLVAMAQQVTDRDINESALLNAQFTRYQVWDAKRNPAYPSVETNWELSKLKSPLDVSTKFLIDWGLSSDRYLMFALDVDRSKSETSLIDDVNNTRARYSVSLNLYEKDGHFVKTISRWGKLIGFGSGGFMYEQEGQIGTFFSTGNARYGGTVMYRPDLAQLEYLSEIVRDKARKNRGNSRNYNGNGGNSGYNNGHSGNSSYNNGDRGYNNGNSGYNNGDKGYNNGDRNNNDQELSFLTATYNSGQVWDAQRSPSSPVIGRDWRLSMFRNPYDMSSSSSINWGRNNDCYLMFELEENNSSNAYTLIDDIDNSGRRYAVTLKLFDRDGRYIKTVSRWGKLMGFGSGGFMYEQEGRFGTFFTGERTGEGQSLVYRPEVAQIRYLSEIVNEGSFLRHPSNPQYRPNIGYHQNAGYRPRKNDSKSGNVTTPSSDPKPKTESGSIYRRQTK